jgi:cation/acetate symporter
MVPAFFISFQMTGNPIPQLGMGGSLSDGTYILEKLDSVLVDLGFNAYTDGSKSTLDVFMITAALMLGTAGLPHVIVRFFTVPKVRDARKSGLYALIFIAILYTTAPAISVFARMNLIETVSDQERANMPEWFNKWEQTGLLSFTDKNGDGKIQYVGDAAKNELTVDRDIITLANPEIARLPNWVIALVAAGGLAAALSTAAGLLLVISSAVSHDVIKKMINPELSEKKELMAARLSAFVAVCVAGYFGINPPGFVASVVAIAFGYAAASFFPAIVMGIFSKRMNKEGAIAGMVAGLGITMIYILKFKLSGITGFEWVPSVLGSNAQEDWWFGISPEGFGTVGMLVNFAVSLSISYLTPAPSAAVQELVEDIRIPAGAKEAVGH